MRLRDGVGDGTFGSGFCVTVWISLMLDMFCSSGGAYHMLPGFPALFRIAWPGDSIKVGAS
jgi:hypothetical protein